MPEPQLSLDRFRELPISLDYARLRAEGIALAQELAGDLWTDYNDHDPGVTLLEQICYALTEVAYKTRFPIEDLLFAEGARTFQPLEHALFPPHEVLPSQALTLRDYRKLIIDRVGSVKNAWVVPLPVARHGMPVRGLYEVLLQLEENTQAAAVVDEVRTLLSSHRNLCEDIESIRPLKAEQISFSADIRIQPEAIGENVIANIIFALSESLTPRIRFLQPDRLEKEGVSLETIFEGPLLLHGYIPDEDLERSELHLLSSIPRSGLIKGISEVTGVASLENMIVTVGQRRQVEEIIQLPAGVYPELNKTLIFDGKAGIRLWIGELEYETDWSIVRQTYEVLVAQHVQRHYRPLDYRFIPPQSRRHLKDIAHFDSIQQTLPPIYGVGEHGMPPRGLAPGYAVTTPAVSDRQVYVRQLKGFILLLDQLLANHLAQLTQLTDAFSIRQPLISPAVQLPASFPGLHELLVGGPDTYRREIGKILETFDSQADRKDRFMDHLLSRFGEDLLGEAFFSILRQGDKQAQNDDQRIALKTDFLRLGASLGRSRGKGFDYLQPQGEGAVGGLKKRLCLLFGLEAAHPHRLSGIYQDARLSRSKASGKSPLTGCTFESVNPRFLDQLLRYGGSRHNFSIRQDDQGKPYALWYQPAGGDDHQVIFAGTEEVCDEKLSALTAYINELNHQSEGFHLLEHILLRPVAPFFCAYRVIIPGEGGKNPQADVNWLTPFQVENPERELVAFVEQLTALGTKADHYQVEKTEKGFSVVLKNPKGGIIMTSSGYLIEETARQAITHTVASIKKLGQNLSACVSIEEPAERGAMLAQDHYSLQLSFLMPGWNAKFQASSVRSLFKAVARQYAPAHLRLRFFWLGMEEMHAFENMYEQWLAEKATLQPVQPRLDQLSFDVIQWIQTLGGGEA